MLQRSSSLLMYSGTVRFCQPGGVTCTYTRGVNKLNGLTEIIYIHMSREQYMLILFGFKGSFDNIIHGLLNLYVEH